ncbi:MAG: efflux RND transporter permease subunit, partial [Pseudomonadota bacterium]
DIAVAISVSVILSLIVAVTVIPALSSRLLAAEGTGDQEKRFKLPIIDHLAKGFVAAILGFTRGVTGSTIRALGFVAIVAGATSFFAITFLPKLEYLPDGNRNFIFGVILPPPGYNLETSTGIAQRLEAAVKPRWASETGPEGEPGEPPKIDNFFFVSTRSNTFVGASVVPEEASRAGELIPVLRGPVFQEPGTFGFMRQASLFGRGIGGSRSIDLDVSGSDLPTILGVALQATGIITQALPSNEGNQFRPKPGLELGAPEIRVIPDPLRLADAGVTANELANAVDTFNDGLRVAEITVDGKRIDLVLRGPTDAIGQTQGIGSIPVVTRDGTIIPVESLAEVAVTSGPTEILHSERVRTVTLEVVPAAGIPLEAALEIVEEQVISPLEEQGLPPGVTLSLSGTADKLSQTWDVMVLDLLLALVIVYLVMAVLFESFLYPLIIMISVPLAAAGGVAGLVVLNLYIPQSLDMLTLLGFVILIGIVVNNAILLVHQSLYHFRRDEMSVGDAIMEATSNRIRPIFMSTLTSVFGMLPLVLFPGAGSELYRGLGSVVVGGLGLSAVLTLMVVPPLLAVFMGVIERRRTERAEKAVKKTDALPSPEIEPAE